tara:strand:- start:213 stop:338 length:126 start_codon:yes stop_codon:yes gene_type:complete
VSLFFFIKKTFLKVAKNKASIKLDLFHLVADQWELDLKEGH